MATWRTQRVRRNTSASASAIPPVGAGGVPARSPRKAPDHPERREQKRIVGFLTSLGAKVWEIGTTRRKGDYQGTMQTPGLPDCIAFLKVPTTYAANSHSLTPVSLVRHQLVIEVKVNGNTLRPEQRDYRQMCLEAGVDHVVGDLNHVIAWLVERGYIKAANVPHYRLGGGR